MIIAVVIMIISSMNSTSIMCVCIIRVVIINAQRLAPAVQGDDRGRAGRVDREARPSSRW